MSGRQALGLGRMQMAPGARRMESSHLAGVIREDFLQELVLEADSEELVGFQRRWGDVKGGDAGCTVLSNHLGF